MSQREHGDVESVLRHYREGTLARWLKMFGHTELAEKVAEHRNAQLEGSRANLHEVFGILEIPLAEEAFDGYCQKNLSDKFVFSDAEDGDLKSYGQGVAIKDKLLPFFPKEGKAAEKLKEELAQWEVTEAELDGGDFVVELTCEKRNISVSFQVSGGDDRYQGIANQLERLVGAFNPIELWFDSESTSNRAFNMVETMAKVVETKKASVDKGQQGWRIGATGPGGGLIFHIDGQKVYEVSEVLGKYTWEEAKKVAESYRGGGFSDWRLPTKEELNLVYQNLRKPGIITGDDWHWSSSQCQYYSHYYYYWDQHFSDGGQDYDHCYGLAVAVRAIRAFST